MDVTVAWDGFLEYVIQSLHAITRSKSTYKDVGSPRLSLCGKTWSVPPMRRHAMILTLWRPCYISSRAVHSANCTPAEFTPGHSYMLSPARLQTRKVRDTVHEIYCQHNLSWRLEEGVWKGCTLCPVSPSKTQFLRCTSGIRIAHE
jgi:hypothetical protein